VAEPPRPAFYALAQGGWRDYATLLHLPYTAWHLSYVAIGAALAPTFSAGRLLAALAAFFLAVGVAAHAFDELEGSPLGTRIARPVLWALAITSLAGAVAIGVIGLNVVGPGLGIFITAGAFLVLAYNLEWFGGTFHSDAWFALAWGAFPVLCGYWAMEAGLAPEAVIAAAFAFALSRAQRGLSTAVRRLRRRAERVEGEIVWRDGSRSPITRGGLMAVHEGALAWLATASVLLACGLVALRL
jgi:hypothetical protein